MEKMKTPDVQLMQAIGVAISTDDDQSTMTGTNPTTNGFSSQGTASQGTNRPSWQGLQILKSGTIYTHSFAQANKHMYDWILSIHINQLISFVIHPMFAMCTK